MTMRLSGDEHGQTVPEYSLLLAFIFLAFICLFLSTASDQPRHSHGAVREALATARRCAKIKIPKESLRALP